MKFTIRKEDYLPLLILFQNNLILYMSIFFYSIPITSWLRYSLFPILVVFSLLVYLVTTSGKISIDKKSVIYFLVVTTILISNSLMFPDNRELIQENLGSLLWCLYGGFFLGLFVFEYITRENDRNWKDLYVICLITLVICIVYTYLTSTTGAVDRYVQDKSDMSTAYHVLPVAMVICWKGIKSPKVSTIIPLIVSIIFVFGLGTRGALIWLLVFVIFSLILKNVYQKKFSKWLILAILMLVLFLFYDDILLWMSTMLKSMGYSIRIFDTINSGGLFISDSRDIITDNAIKLIQENALFGYGIFSDRYYLGDYCHNLFLELLMNYGVFFGSIILIVLFYIIISAFFKAPSLEHKIFEMVLFFSSVGLLIKSGSYLQNPLFYVLIAYCVSIISNNRIIHLERNGELN